MEPNEYEDLYSRVQEWIEHDPDSETRTELEELLEKGDIEALNDRFYQRLTFGTAGIRGAQGSGPNHMNRLTVRRVAQGIAEYLRAGATVIIGYDARKNSKAYAEDFATVFSHRGINSLVFPTVVPTPVLAFAVRRKQCDLGVMVTASHNPSSDNGCKIFLSDGAQLRSPDDEEIDAHIQRSEFPQKDIAKGRGEIQEIDNELWNEYCSAIANTVPKLSDSLTIAYTPMHGVGWATIQRVFSLAGIPNLVAVPSQMHPDPDFPTSPFPNPEIRGSMDELFKVARESKADLAIANDPDGDRLAVAIPLKNGEWRALTGDEIGALLCSRMLEMTTGQDRKIVSTVVCSSLVGKIASEAAVAHVQTLTGFKWIIPEAYRDLTKNPIFSYEEALGYSVSGLVRDKDGISAALRFVEMAEDLKKKNLTVLDKINEIFLKHGLHVTRSEGIQITNPAASSHADLIGELLNGKPPDGLGGFRTLEFSNYDSYAADAGINLPPSNMVRVVLEGGIRILVRPSGTEPVVKSYLEKVIDVGEENVIEQERMLTHRAFDRVVGDLRAYLNKT